ncbi:3-phosphoshikimate 1-carboxyvinyltransferase 2 [Hibiscus syriacus]|uniref:3-phosphoshikimate 1-carboxyvinyltransferase 2 n=1 Tax=Hibiscus syriacus TaxID=106335 RepID=A0A6A3CI42_HIBSY|nr:3-phosphoshikimate 1-carboxyvinyltransferase 2 [Hibiscus syriacus]
MGINCRCCWCSWRRTYSPPSFNLAGENRCSWDASITVAGSCLSIFFLCFCEEEDGDASSASYFLVGAEVTGGIVTVEGCGTSSLQGDVKFSEVLEKMGANVTWTENSITVTGPQRNPSGRKHLHAIDVNMNKMPDVAMSLAVVALYADGPTAIRDAPTRKRPRPVKYEDETTQITPPPVFPVMNNSISSTTSKVEIYQPAKIEAASPNFEKNTGSVVENLMNYSEAGLASSELDQAEPMKEVKSIMIQDSKPLCRNCLSVELQNWTST